MSKTQTAALWFVGAIGIIGKEIVQIISAGIHSVDYGTLSKTFNTCPNEMVTPIHLTPEIMRVLGFEETPTLWYCKEREMELSKEILGLQSLHELQYFSLASRDPFDLQIQKLQEVVK